MILKIISDTHNNHNLHTNLECDVLIHCGDFATKGNYTECYNFLQWFVKQPAKYKLFVTGNHDRHIRDKDPLKLLADTYGLHYLNNSGIIINGIYFWGNGYTPSVDKTGTYHMQHDFLTRKNAWKNMPDNIDVLITHVPPKGILDKNIQGVSCGCDQLLEQVKIKKPKYNVFGHIHEQGGLTARAYDTVFINTAVKNENYKTVRDYKLVQLDDIV